jgi:glycosyltransferase involved in cell wall biosynthesis
MTAQGADPRAGNVVAAVSVIVPCYRCKATIGRAIASIEAQTLQPAEIILVDDASGDGTLEELQRIRERLGGLRVKVLSLEKNAGAGEARNAGWNAASSYFVAFLDADDAWHPRKIELQYAFMREHPEFAASGHGHRIVRGGSAVDASSPEEGHTRIGRLGLLLSNRFITPSAMVRRDIALRFRSGKRYMEDHALWLDIVTAGMPVARLHASLASIFKAPFGEAGLSARVLEMEAGELAMYRDLWREGALSLPLLLALWTYSGGKFIRRLFLSLFRPRETRFAWMFPLAYLSVTHSIPALLILLGLTGRPELAAEVAVISGATIATFYAFSANTRALILAGSESVTLRDIVASRLILVLPLGIAAVVLSAVSPAVNLSLAGILVLRRAAEWFSEVHLSDAELRSDRTFAKRFLFMQVTLFAAAAVALAAGHAHAMVPVCVWALAPLAVSIRFIAKSLRGPGHQLIGMLPALLPHIGSSAIMGVSIYAFRLLILLFVEKAAAGDLFVAVAIGSFLGTLFANVLGPSFMLDQARTGMSALPAPLRLALVVALAGGAGLVIFAVPLSQGALGLAKSAFFWTATGLSLIGSTAMVAAQRVRLRVLSHDDGRDLFGPDVLTHVLLIAAIPFAVGLGGPSALAGIYLLNAALAFVFYKTSEFAYRRDIAGSASEVWNVRICQGIGFAMTLPAFFLLSGRVYNVATPVVDSGGLLLNLPLPISIVACFLGIVLLGGYRRAGAGYAFIFALFAFMLASILVTPADQVVQEKRKFLLLMQCLLPAFGMALAMQAAKFDASSAPLERAMGTAIILIVPAQLLATWLRGELALTHDVWFFSVYQHWQYVPTILCGVYVVALSRLWSLNGWGITLKAGAPLMAIYSFASVSTLSIALLMLGMVAITLHRFLIVGRQWVHALPLLAAIIAVGTYGLAFRDNPAFTSKYAALGTGSLDAQAPCSGLLLARVNKGIAASDGNCEIRVANPSTGDWLLISRPYRGSSDQSLRLEGELHEGLLRVGFLKFGAWHSFQDVTSPGTFSIAVPIPEDLGKSEAFEAALAYMQPNRLGEVRGSITRFTTQRSGTETRPASSAQLKVPPNFLERFGDWGLYGRQIFDSPKTFLFGHAVPIDRSIRTSAHNYYLDMAYLFGVLALLPLFGLLLLTLLYAWRARRCIAVDPSLAALLVVVLFLVVVDSNFKVTLRQPYPGIATFFLWGLLLARLRRPERDKSANVANRLHAAFA